MSSRMLRRLDPSSDLELIAEVSQLVTQFDMQRVLGKVIRLVANAVGATRAHLFLHPNYELDWRNIFQTDRLDPDTIFSASVGGFESGLPGLAAQERKGILVRDVMMDERRYAFGNELRDHQSALAVPLICNQDMMAVLLLLHPTPEHFTDKHLQVVQIAMNQAAVAVHNARLENHVRSGRHQFQAVLHAVNNPMLVLDRDGNVQMMNDAANRFFETAQMPLKTGSNLPQVVGEDSAFTRILSIIANPPQSENHWLFKTHSEHLHMHFDVLMSEWDNPMQGETGFVVMMHDVTTLIELDRFKNDMLRMASHDLRSPLALITGYCDVIEMDLPPDVPNLRGYLDAVRRTTTRMDNLLTDLLRIERIQSSPLELYEPIVIRDLLATVMEHMEPSAVQKHQSLTTDFHDLPDYLVADTIMIREAMENFVSNAIKYTPEGGNIIVRSFSRGTTFYFIVEDNGVGIGPEHMPKLFTSFYRAKQAGTEHIDGTGVGLSLVKTVVERHQGKVWVESQVGVGSQFGFWLPLNA